MVRESLVIQLKECAVYKGEDILAIGTDKECAAQLGIKPETVRFYASPIYLSRVEKRKSHNYIIAVKLDNEDE